MGVLKVWDGTDWRKGGCGGVAAGTISHSETFTGTGNYPTGPIITDGITWVCAGSPNHGLTGTGELIFDGHAFDLLNSATRVVLDVGAADGSMTLTGMLQGSSTYWTNAVWRCSATYQDYWILLQNGNVQKVISNGLDATVHLACGAIPNNATVEIICDGDLHEVIVNGVSAGTFTDSFNQTETRWGPGSQQGGGFGQIASATFTMTTPATSGRLRLWAGTGWVREACDDDDHTDAHPLKIKTASGGDLLFTDDFARSDSANVLGGPWSLYSTSGNLADIDVGVSSGKGYVSRTDTISSHVCKAFAYVDAGTGDIDLTMDVSGFSGFEEAAIVVRLAPDGSHIRITRNSVYTVSAVSGNTYTATNLSLATNIGSGATVRILCTGTTIEVFKNGVSQGTVTTSHNQTATRHGWSTDTVFDPAARFDNVVAITPADVWTTVACMVPVTETADLTADSTRYVVQDGSYNSSPAQVHVGFAFYWKSGTVLFTSLPDLAGRTITSAVLRVKMTSTQAGGANTRIYLDDSATPVTPTSGADLLAKTHTTAFTTWTGPAGTAGDWVDSPDFSAVLQEVVDAHGAVGAIQILHDYTGTDNFEEFIYHGEGSGFEPQLLLTFT